MLVGANTYESKYLLKSHDFRKTFRSLRHLAHELQEFPTVPFTDVVVSF